MRLDGGTMGGTITFDTVSTAAAFEALGGDWDELVRAMPRPTPFLLHAWLSEWWRHYGVGADLAVEVAFRDGKLVAALPLCRRSRYGLRVTTFLGGQNSALADLLLAAGEDEAVAVALAGRASRDHDYADLAGLPVASRLATSLGPARLRLIERNEAPVLDLERGWEEIYRTRTSAKRRSLHRRRRRQLMELGRLEVTTARGIDELGPALEEAFRLHALRWLGRPDGSEFATASGVQFHRAALRALAALDVPRIVSLKLDGRTIAFHYYFAFERCMYVHHLAFDPALGRFSPGLLNTLDTIEIAAEEGLARVEFLGGAERYKIELADRLEPLYEGLGLEGSSRGRAAIALRLHQIRLRKRLKRSPALRRLYFEGLAPARRVLAAVQQRART